MRVKAIAGTDGTQVAITFAMTLRADRHPRAFVLVAGVLAVSLVGLIGALLARSHDRLAEADRCLAHAQAVASAEAGMAVAIETVRSHGPAADLGPADRPLGGALCTVRVNRISGDRVVFVSRGEHEGFTRTLTETWRFNVASGTARRCHER